MTVGMFLAAMAFVCAALVQLEIDKTLPTFPTTSESQLKLLNMRPDQVTVDLPFPVSRVELPPNTASPEYYTFEEDVIEVAVPAIPATISIPLVKGHRQTLLMSEGRPEEWQLTDDLISKPEKGKNGVRFVNGANFGILVNTKEADFGLIFTSTATNYSLLNYGKQTFTIRTGIETCEFIKDFGFGSSYTFFIPSTFTITANCGDAITVVEDIKPNSVHMALQIPQYFFITAGEVMFSVTGLEFSYSQAPSNMKSVLQAGWLLTVAVGNFIVLIVAELAKLPKQWTEYVLFASLLVAVCIIFSIMAYFYTYMDPTQIEAQFKNKDDDDYDDKNKDRRHSQKSEMEMEKKSPIYENTTHTKM